MSNVSNVSNVSLLPPDMVLEVVAHTPSSTILPLMLANKALKGFVTTSRRKVTFPTDSAIVRAGLQTVVWAAGLGWRWPCFSVKYVGGTKVKKYDPYAACRLVAGESGGNLEVISLARLCGCEWDTSVAASSVSSGLPMLQWVINNGCPWDEKTCEAAAAGGHLEVLKWARKKGCPWDATVCGFAARGGHLEVLKWAHDNGCPWDEWTCSAAAQHGHLDVLKWARKNGCPWSKETLIWAAMAGKREVVEWAFYNECPLSRQAITVAAQGGHLGVLAWLWDNAGPEPPSNTMLCALTAQSGQLECLKWLCANNCPWDESTVTFAKIEGHDHIAEWALGNGCPAPAE